MRGSRGDTCLVTLCSSNKINLFNSQEKRQYSRSLKTLRSSSARRCTMLTIAPRFRPSTRGRARARASTWSNCDSSKRFNRFYCYHNFNLNCDFVSDYTNNQWTQVMKLDLPLKSPLWSPAWWELKSKCWKSAKFSNFILCINKI